MNEPQFTPARYVFFYAASTDRRALVSWAEMQAPDAPRRAWVSWAELEVPDVGGGGVPRRMGMDLAGYMSLKLDG